MRNSLTRLSTVVPRVAALALLATSFAVPQVHAGEYPAPLRSLEDVIESSTDDVLLPASQPGTLTFRNCAEPCKLRALQVSAQSAFFVGDTQVSLAEFNAYVRGAGSRSLMVFRQPDQATASRIRVAGQMTPGLTPGQKGSGKPTPAKKQ